MTPDAIYYECHVSLQPVKTYEESVILQDVCTKHNFKVATLLMQKTLDPNELDSFCTGRDKKYDYLKGRMESLLSDLNKNNFKIFRYKIEAIILDSKINNGE